MAFPSTRRPSSSGFGLAAAWILGVLGFGAALIGAYLALAPEDGVLRVFTQTWAVSELRDLWPQALLIGGGAVAVIGMGLALRAGRGRPTDGGRALSAVVLACGGAVAIGAGILVAI